MREKASQDRNEYPRVGFLAVGSETTSSKAQAEARAHRRRDPSQDERFASFPLESDRGYLQGGGSTGGVCDVAQGQRAVELAARIYIGVPK